MTGLFTRQNLVIPKRTFTLALLLWLAACGVWAQGNAVKGQVTAGNAAVSYASVLVEGTSTGATTDSLGHFTISLTPGNHTLKVSAVGYQTLVRSIEVNERTTTLQLTLTEDAAQLDEVVVTGTMKEVSKMNSAIPVEVYSPSFFIKNPTPNIFESLSLVNGVQPQVNCNVCNTGDIHINGLEGPYTMILIDGMPIVSSLATVYGLAGIPNSLVRRMEIVKGPASTLYGSEAVGGVINIITKDPQTAPRLKADVFATTIGEHNLDLSAGARWKRASTIVGLNVFDFWNKRDINNDNFTDATLQRRLSLFNKWQLNRPAGKTTSLAARYIYENRWGGEMQWTRAYRGSDQVYGESIYTSRVEVLGTHSLTESIAVDVSYNHHLQDSYYGTTKYYANQDVAFAQARWSKQLGMHDLLAGVPLRFTYYDDNTVGTARNDGSNHPAVTFLPGVFVQDEITVTKSFTTLLGARYDHHSVHGSIVSPRVSFKLSPDKNNTIRLTAGNGYRVVNLFTEDHAALTGSRTVEIIGDLKPESSWNVNLNFARAIPMAQGFVNVDASLFYTYFTNKIVANYDVDPDKIVYDNLDGYAISKGLTLNADVTLASGFKLISGITWMDVYRIDRSTGEGNKIPQVHAPKFSGTFTLSYEHAPSRITIDLTGKVNGPMYLPVVPNDYRPAMSPWFALVNVQVTKAMSNNLEVYAGIKNLLNFKPQDPLLRPFDPFDKHITENNPYGYTFDTTYNYAPLQGLRGMVGVRWTLE